MVRVILPDGFKTARGVYADRVSVGGSGFFDIRIEAARVSALRGLAVHRAEGYAYV